MELAVQHMSRSCLRSESEGAYPSEDISLPKMGKCYQIKHFLDFLRIQLENPQPKNLMTLEIKKVSHQSHQSPQSHFDVLTKYGCLEGRRLSVVTGQFIGQGGGRVVLIDSGPVAPASWLAGGRAEGGALEQRSPLRARRGGTRVDAFARRAAMAGEVPPRGLPTCVRCPGRRCGWGRRNKPGICREFNR